MKSDGRSIERKKPEKNKASIAASIKAERLQEKHEDELDRAAEEAMRDVGITLERKDRANIKSVVFPLIKDRSMRGDATKLCSINTSPCRMCCVAVCGCGWKPMVYDWPDGNSNATEREVIVIRKRGRK